MSDGIRDQLRGLEYEQQRLEARLASDANWSRYKEACAARDAAGEPDDAPLDLPEDVAAALEANRLFKAYENVVRAKRLLAELLPRNPDVSVDDTIEETPPPDEPLHSEPSPVGAAGAAGAGLRAFLAMPRGVRPSAHLAVHRAAPAPRDQDGAEPDVPPPAETPADTAEAAADPLPDPEVAEPEQTVAMVPTPANDDEPGRLEQIRGMSPAQRALLAELGVTRCSEIAAWSATDVAHLRAHLGANAPRGMAEWIEQAAILARGGTTQHARRLVDLDLSGSLVAPPALVAWQAALMPSPPSPPMPTRLAIDEAAPLQAIEVRQSRVSGRIVQLERAADAIDMGDAFRSAPLPTAAETPVDRTEPVEPASEDERVTLADSETQSADSAGTGVLEHETATDLPTQPRGDEAGAGDEDQDNEERTPAGEFEADVEIVIRRPSAVAPKPAQAQPTFEPTPAVEPNKTEPAAPAATSWLARRLARDRADEADDARNHAAYREAVVEASVEIIRSGTARTAESAAEQVPVEQPAPPQPNAGEIVPDNAPEPNAAATDDADEGKSKDVSAFLRALTGDDRA